MNGKYLIVLCLFIFASVSCGRAEFLATPVRLERSASVGPRLVRDSYAVFRTVPEEFIIRGGLSGSTIGTIKLGEGEVDYQGLKFTIPDALINEMYRICMEESPASQIIYTREIGCGFMSLRGFVRNLDDSWTAIFFNRQEIMQDMLDQVLISHINRVSHAFEKGKTPDSDVCDSIFSIDGNRVDELMRINEPTVRNYMHWLSKNPEMVRHDKKSLGYLILYAFLSPQLKDDREYDDLRTKLKGYFEKDPGEFFKLWPECRSYTSPQQKQILRVNGFIS